MRIRVTIDDDVFQAVRAQAEASGKRIGEVLSEITREGLRGSSKPVNRMPMFEIPPGAEIIPTNRVTSLLSEKLA